MTEAVTTVTTWTIDPIHSVIGFAVKHMMLTTAKGRFAEFSGAIGFDEQHVERSSVEVTVRPGSIHTGAAERDAHLRSADFFDVERYPTATFRSTRIEPNDQDRFAVHGDLTIKGVTRDVVLDAVFQGSGTVPGDSDVVSLDIQAGRA